MATILYHITGKILPLGVIILILNLPLFLAVIKMESKGFLITTLAATLMLSVITDLTAPHIDRIIGPLIQSEFKGDGGDLLVSCLIGGLMVGI